MSDKAKSRDQEILATLQALTVYWSARPHLRLAQVIVNAASASEIIRGAKQRSWSCPEVFYLSDRLFLSALTELMKNGWPEAKT